MNTTTKVLVGISLVLSVLGLILPRYSALPSLGGITRDQLTIDTSNLANGYALTVTGDESSFAGLVNSSGSRMTSLNVSGASTLTGAQTLTASTTFSALQLNASSGSNGIIWRSTTDGTCWLMTYNGKAFVTSTMTCL